MREGLHITPSLIRRRYDQGLDSIVHLVGDLEARIEDLTALHVSNSQASISAQMHEIKRMEQTIANKNAELVKVYQLNKQLERCIRELEKCLEADPSSAPPVTMEICRDLHNSNQPPSLDLPWIKPKRTRSLRQRSGLRVGGQPNHPGATLRQVSTPDRIIIHKIDNCSQCNTSLQAVKAIRFFRRQVFEIENGCLSVVEHRTPLIVCPDCGSVSKGKFPLAVTAPVQYGASVLSRTLYLHLYQLLPIARTPRSNARSVRLFDFASFDSADCPALIHKAYSL